MNNMSDDDLVRAYILRKQEEDAKRQQGQEKADNMRMIAGVTEGLGSALGGGGPGVAYFKGWGETGSPKFDKGQQVKPNMETLRAQAANTEQRADESYKGNMQAFDKEQSLTDLQTKRSREQESYDAETSTDGAEAEALRTALKKFNFNAPPDMSVKEMRGILDPAYKAAGLELDRNKATAGKAVNPNDIIKNEERLRREMGNNPAIKNFALIDGQFGTYNSVKDQKTGPADEARIVMFNKLLDPDSVVRESEFARTTQGQALLGQLQQFAGKITTGAKLTDDMRAKLDSTMQAIYKGAQQNAMSQMNRYYQTVDDFEFKPERVIPHWAMEDYRQSKMPLGAQQAPASAPAPTQTAPSPGVMPPPAPGKVRVTNGKEILDIDQADLQDAMNDGYTLR